MQELKIAFKCFDKPQWNKSGIWKICQTCSRYFYAFLVDIKRGGGIYCGIPCIRRKNNVVRNKYCKEKINVKCLRCSKNFSIYQSQLNNERGRYCSTKCAKENHVIKTCPICRAKFQVIMSVVGRERGKYCSKKCYMMELEQRHVEKKCVRCGKIFTTTLAVINYKNGAGQYCSFNCRRFVIRTLKSQIRRSVKYLSWKNTVLNRDDMKCVRCGHNNKLHAHHIKRFSLILFENNIKTLEQALECKELWDVNNGQTLCEDCHKKETFC